MAAGKTPCSNLGHLCYTDQWFLYPEESSITTMNTHRCTYTCMDIYTTLSLCSRVMNEMQIEKMEINWKVIVWREGI